MSALSGASVLLELRLRLLLRRGLNQYTRRSLQTAPWRLLLAVLAIVWLSATIVIPLTDVVLHAAREPAARDTIQDWLSWCGILGGFAIFSYSVLGWIGRLTYDTDLRLLMSTPLSAGTVIAERLGAYCLGYSLLLLFTLPSMVGIGNILGFGLPYTLVAISVVLVLPVFPVSLALLAVLLVVRLVPPHRARGAAAFLSVSLGAATFIAVQYLAFQSAGNRLSWLASNSPAWVPFVYPAHALAATGLGRPREATAYALATIASSAVMAALAVWLGGVEMQAGVAAAEESRPSASDPRRSERSGWTMRWNPTPVQSGWRVILMKDLLTVRRDPLGVAQLAYPLVLVGLYAYGLIAGGGAATLPAFQISLSILGLAILTCVLLVGSSASSAVNHEGRSLYILALAPIPDRSLFIEKWAFCCLPPLLASEAVAVVLSVVLHASRGMAVLTIVVVGPMTVAIAGLSLLVHLAWPRLVADGNRRRGSNVGTLVAFVVNLLLGGLSGILLSLAVAFAVDRPLVAAACWVALILVLAGACTLSDVAGPRLLRGVLSRDAAPQ